MLVLFPITSQPPSCDRFAVEISEMEKRRAGLDVALRLWIILDEYNQDVIGRSFYLEPEPPIGRFSKAFLPVTRPHLSSKQRNTAALIRQLLGKSVADRHVDRRLFSGAIPIHVSTLVAAHAMREPESILRQTLAGSMDVSVALSAAVLSGRFSERLA
jgi:hypothetical protein